MRKVLFGLSTAILTFVCLFSYTFAAATEKVGATTGTSSEWLFDATMITFSIGFMIYFMYVMIFDK